MIGLITVLMVLPLDFAATFIIAMCSGRVSKALSIWAPPVLPVDGRLAPRDPRIHGYPWIGLD